MCPRLHGSGPAVVSPCCFVNSGWSGWTRRPLPRTPRPRSPTLMGASLPITHPRPSEGYLRLGLQFPGCGDLGWGGRGRRCVQGIAGPPEGEAGAPRASPRRLPVPRVPQLATVPGLALWAAAGHPVSRALPASFPSGSEAPGGRAPDLPGASNPLREAWVLCGVFWPAKGLFWDISSILNYFLNPSPCSDSGRPGAARRSLPPPSPASHLPTHLPKCVPGSWGPSRQFFQLSGMIEQGLGSE